ncbi:hypothetical protein BKA81DRAFT_370314 [Phyllosticta paracitricarpa]
MPAPGIRPLGIAFLARSGPVCTVFAGSAAAPWIRLDHPQSSSNNPTVPPGNRSTGRECNPNALSDLGATTRMYRRTGGTCAALRFPEHNP